MNETGQDGDGKSELLLALVAWLVGLEMTAFSPSPPLYFCAILSLSPHLMLPLLSLWIIMFLVSHVVPALAVFHFHCYPVPPVFPCLSLEPLPTHFSFYDAEKNAGAQQHLTFWNSILAFFINLERRHFVFYNSPIQAVAQGQPRCSVPTSGMPPCTPCKIPQTPSSHHWSGTGTLLTCPHPPWNIVVSQGFE